MGYNNTKPRCIIAPKDYHIVGSAQNGTKMAASWGTNSIKIHAKKGLQGATWVMQTVKLFWICRCFRHLVTASLQEVALLKLPLNQSYQKLEDISFSLTLFHWSHGSIATMHVKITRGQPVFERNTSLRAAPMSDTVLLHPGALLLCLSLIHI